MTRVCDLERRPVVVVVGGGFSGLLTALHLLEHPSGVVVRLVEKSDRFALGRAYAPADEGPKLNVRAANMSAFADRPTHFVDWLAAHGGGEGFVSRARYGEYLQSLLREAVRRSGAPGRLLLEQDEVVEVSPEEGRFRVRLALGRHLRADAVVLATGLGAPSGVAGRADLAPPLAFGDPWAVDPKAAPAGDILLIGTGLTMIDVALALDRPDRRLTAVSRRGLLPSAHAATAVAPPPPGDLGTPLRALRSLRAHADEVGWRSAVDSIRPLTPDLWRRWSLDQRRRFLRHARPWWDVRRHRMAPDVAQRIGAMADAGRLAVLAARIERLEVAEGGVEVTWRRRGADARERRTFAALVDCTGLSSDLAASPVLAGLVSRGLARPDPLRLGLDLDAEFRVVGDGGAVTPGLYAVGPLARAARWETVAVPDLRLQTRELADTIHAELREVTAQDARVTT